MRMICRLVCRLNGRGSRSNIMSSISLQQPVALAAVALVAAGHQIFPS